MTLTVSSKEKGDMKDKLSAATVTLSIIIITKDTKELLRQLLRSIEQDEFLKAFLQETIIIDNASADGTDDMVGSEFPWTVYVRNDRNMGFAASENQGIGRSTGKYALLLNSDTILIEGEISKMVDFMEDNPDVGICGPQLVYPDMRPQRSSASIPSLLTELFPFHTAVSSLFALWATPPASGRPLRASCCGYGIPCTLEGRGNAEDGISAASPCADNKHEDHVGVSEAFQLSALRSQISALNSQPSARDVPSIIGAAMMIRKALFNDLSGFDERFFFFLEETDLCLRARRPSAISRQPSADSYQQIAISGRQPASIIDNRASSIEDRTSDIDHQMSGDLSNVEHRTLNVEPVFSPSRVVLLSDARVIHLQGKTVGKNWLKGRIEYNISLYKFIKKHHSTLYYRAFQAARFLKSTIMILVLSLLPFLLIGKGIRRRYVYYWKVLLWHLAACPPTAGLRS